MSKRIFLGLDMGGTDIKGTATNDAGDILISDEDWTKIESFARQGPQKTLQQLKLAGQQALDLIGSQWEDVVCVGLDTPGPASLDGELSQSPNLNHPEWNNFGVREELEKVLGRPVIYNNDGNAAAYWEYFRLFKDGKEKILAAAILGTGLGGALIHKGEVVTGARGFGAEFGHIRLPTHKLVPQDQPSPVCGCGKEGCAEAYVSLTALKYYMDLGLALPENKDHPLHQMEDVENSRAKSLLKVLKLETPSLKGFLISKPKALGLLFVQLANCFDPHIFIVGGGLTEGKDENSKKFIDRFIGL